MSDQTRILGRMFRGLLALGLAICVTGAPVATDLCQAVCAARSTDAASHPTGAHHSCHGEAPASGVSLTEVHACGHTDALPGSDRPEHVSAALAIVPAVTDVAAPVGVAARDIALLLFSPPPIPASSSQLRV